MDFAKLDARTGSETAQRMALVHPITGKAITNDGKPCFALVLGSHSRAIQATRLAEAKAKMTAKVDDDDSEKTAAGLHQAFMEFALTVLTGFENVMIDGRAATLEDGPRIMDLFMTVASKKPYGFAHQVVDFANEVAHFLPSSSAP